MDGYLHNALILCMDKNTNIIRKGWIKVAGGRIAEVKPGELRTTKGTRLDARGKVLMPALVNGHMHFYSLFARGMPVKTAEPRNFQQLLRTLWWNLDRALDEEAVYLSALVSIMEGIKSGTATYFDHHSSPSIIRGSLPAIARAVIEAGVRADLCYESTDRNGKRLQREAQEENLDFIRAHAKGSQLRGHMGLHASFTLSDKALREASAICSAQQVGCHIHCAEAQHDQNVTRKKYGLRVVERLARFGLLSPQTILAHGIHLSAKELTMVQKSGSLLVHNPSSNMNNHVGRFPLEKLWKQGVKFGLGTDGMWPGMWPELQSAFLVHRDAGVSGSVIFPALFEALFRVNPACASDNFGVRLGVIEKGAAADLMLLDYVLPTPLTPENLPGQILFGMAQSRVDTLMVGGKIVMKGGRLQTLKEEEIREQAQRTAGRVWKKVQSFL